MVVAVFGTSLISEDAVGGGKKRGVENLTNDTPPKQGFWTPPRTVRFPPFSDVSALFFLHKNPRQSRPEALLEGSKNFRESAFSGTLSSPHAFCTPHITAQLSRVGMHGDTFSIKALKNVLRSLLLPLK